MPNHLLEKIMAKILDQKALSALIKKIGGTAKDAAGQHPAGARFLRLLRHVRPQR